MPRDEFDLLTPSEWVAIWKQWKKKQLREDIRVARILTMIAATTGVTSSIRDHLPEPPPLPKLDRKKKYKQTPAQIVERQFVSLFPKSANLKPQWPPTQ